MAEAIERKQIRSLPVVDPSRLRARLRSGDLLFAAGDYLISKAIQQATGSPWSHVAIVWRMPGIEEILLLESVEDMGVRFAPLSRYLDDYERGRPYRGQIVIARCDGLDARGTQRLGSFGVEELTRPYDRDEIGKIVARIALGRGRRDADREYICSELVFECFARAGKTFSYDRRGFISPHDIWVDEEVSRVARIL
jgi:hypothetical protein